MSERFLVSGIHTIPEYPPIALGMCMTYAKQMLASDSRISVSPDLLANDEDLADRLAGGLAKTGCRHILLFSSYLWNSAENLRLSRLAKSLDPDCITIHGGPDAPAYSEASKAYLLREPHVDFIVAGEGEETLAELIQTLALPGGEQNISIDGLRYLSKGELVETGQRARARDVNKFPSPYLTGFFDGDDLTKWQSATIETFRGCPYGCTFCDWGSIMGSKVSLFDIDRVAAEIEWVAAHKINTIWIADSNFGISQRDVEIAKKVCEVKNRTGYPKSLILTFAKNIKSRVVDIVQLMVDAGLLGQGIISLQTSDPETLRVIRRSNIKTSEYEKLRQTFAERNLPLCVELMMALPGSTVEAFKGDLAYHFDLPIEVFVHRTVMLTNSPMADPAYQREHGIRIDKDNRVVSTATMTSEDIEVASAICRVFQGVHRFGILRYPLRWLQWEKGINPLDVIHDLVRDNQARADYPLLDILLADAGTTTDSIGDLVDTLASTRERFRSQMTWADLSIQFISWASRRYNFGENPALDALGAVQARLMPTEGLEPVASMRVKNDVVSWYADWLQGCGAELASYGEATLSIEDPFALSSRSYFESMTGVPSYVWELESALFEARRESSRRLPVSTEPDVPPLPLLVVEHREGAGAL